MIFEIQNNAKLLELIRNFFETAIDKLRVSPQDSTWLGSAQTQRVDY